MLKLNAVFIDDMIDPIRSIFDIIPEDILSDGSPFKSQKTTIIAILSKGTFNSIKKNKREFPQDENDFCIHENKTTKRILYNAKDIDIGMVYKFIANNYDTSGNNILLLNEYRIIEDVNKYVQSNEFLKNNYNTWVVDYELGGVGTGDTILLKIKDFNHITIMMTGNTNLHDRLQEWRFDGVYKKSDVNAALGGLPQVVFDTFLKKNIHFTPQIYFYPPVYEKIFSRGSDGYILVHSNDESTSDCFIGQLFDEQKRYFKFKKAWNDILSTTLPDCAQNIINIALNQIDNLKIQNMQDAVSKIIEIKNIMGESLTHSIMIGELDKPIEKYYMKDRFKLTYPTLQKYLNGKNIKLSLEMNVSEKNYFIVPRSLFDPLIKCVCEESQDLNEIKVTVTNNDLLIFSWQGSGRLISDHVNNTSLGNGVRNYLYNIAKWFDVYMQDASGRAILCTEERKIKFQNKVIAYLNTCKQELKGQVIIMSQDY